MNLNMENKKPKNTLMAIVFILLVIVLLVVWAGLRTREARTYDVDTTTSQNIIATSTNSVLSEESIKNALSYTVSRHGLSMLIMQNGKTIFENYHNGYRVGDDHFLASGSKSFSGVILAALIQDGYVSSFDEKVSDTITEWKSDPKKKDITLRQLLSLSSGLSPGENGKAPTFSEAIKADVIAPVGTFQYGPTPYQVFGEFAQRKLNGKDPRIYLKQRVLDPIGVTVASWRNLPNNGGPTLPGGASMQAREWAEFGEFMRNRGMFEGKQIIKPELINELVTLQTIGSVEQYGITFWLGAASDATEIGTKYASSTARNSAEEQELLRSSPLPEFFMAAGAGKQRLYVIDSLGLVIVLQADSVPKDNFSDVEFLGALLGGK